jgi:hypothetical protein
MEYFEIMTYADAGKQSLAGGMGQKRDGNNGITNCVGVMGIEGYIEKLRLLGLWEIDENAVE